jgi:hypothetical protein
MIMTMSGPRTKERKTRKKDNEKKTERKTEKGGAVERNVVSSHARAPKTLNAGVSNGGSPEEFLSLEFVKFPFDPVDCVFNAGNNDILKSVDTHVSELYGLVQRNE